MTTICLQLGNATAGDTSSYSQTFVARTADDIASSKKGLVPSSLDKLDVVVDGADLGTMYNPMELANWAPFLSPTSVVSIRVRGAAAGGDNTKIDLRPVNTSFLLAGLIGASERREADGSRILTATKRKFAPRIGAVPLRTKKESVVTVNLDTFGTEDGGDDADVIDEDGLLDGGLLAPPPAMSAVGNRGDDDCAGRKPCDNCSCGRAEVYAAEQEGEGASGEPGGARQPGTRAPGSACGKCNLGDAFRCASCPFLGKPAFKAGEEHVVLEMMDDL